MLKKISLEEIARKKSLRNKEYLVREIDNDTGGNLFTAELQCKGSAKGIMYVSSQRFRKDEREKVCLDKEGLPYFEKTLGPITYQVYEEIFLGNTGLGSAMTHANQKLLREILRKIKKKKHPVYQEFRSYIGKLIKEAPKIKEALDKKYFFHDERGLANFSELDLEIFKYLTAKSIRALSRDYDPDNHYVKNIKLHQIQHVDFYTGSTKEEAAFMLWYRNYMSSKNYRNKIEDPWSKSSKALEEWVSKVSENLEAKGFRRVEQFT